jgi:hypothetical protein
MFFFQCRTVSPDGRPFVHHGTNNEGWRPISMEDFERHQKYTKGTGPSGVVYESRILRLEAFTLLPPQS